MKIENAFYLKIELRLLFGPYLTLTALLIQEKKIIAVLPIPREFLRQ